VARAADRIVSNTSEFRAALGSAAEGDRLLLKPGVYAGGHYRSGLKGVTIRSEKPDEPAIIRGGANSIQLSDASHVTIEHLILEQQTGNGINIDDGGSFATPTTDITLRNLIVRSISGSGNRDGIKLSGVTRFMIDNVRVFDWGDGGSAVDMVGSHHGLIQNSLFRHDSLSINGSVLRPKGGSKGIVMRANRIELPDGTGRAIQAGGSTGGEFFRFIDGDSGYEARDIVAEGNVVIGGSSPFSYVNIDGGLFHHNYSQRPIDWVVRILNENPGNAIVDTRNGVFTDNIVRFHDSANEFKTAVNVGAETMSETFSFARNQWYNEVNPAQSRPTLPVRENNPILGREPAFDSTDVIPWSFEWGVWLVNANENPNSYRVESAGNLRLAIPHDGAEFRPLDDQPFVGSWSFESITNSSVSLMPFSQAFLTHAPRLGDFDANGVLDAADIDALSAAVRAGSNDPAFDLTGDTKVDQDDRMTWVTEIRSTFFGDSNLDGEFNSSDLVFTFQQGRYEDGASGVSWSAGDWDGDGRFSSRDLVQAFQDGGFENGPRAAAAHAAPEPTGMGVPFLLTAATFLLRRRRPELTVN
jgi:hypothetical protein